MTAGRGRGQLVLLAAVTLAVALVPMTIAYLQLGYDTDVRSVTAEGAPLGTVERTLRRTLDDATAPVPANYSWAERRAAVSTVRSRLGPGLRAINASRLTAETVTEVSYNSSRARAWADARCPSGPARRFGPCRVDRGLVVQERADRTHVLAVAVDVRRTAPRGDLRGTLVIRPVDPD